MQTKSGFLSNWKHNFIEIVLRHGCSPVNLLHISRTPFRKNTSGGLLLDIPRTHEESRVEAVEYLKLLGMR